MKKIRIVPGITDFDINNIGFEVQLKKWYGWRTIFKSYHSIKPALDYIEGLKNIMEFELIK